MTVLFLHALCLSIAINGLVWLIYLKIKNPTIIDVFWPISIASQSSLFYFSGNPSGYTSIYWILLLLWASRLSLYLLVTRIFKKHIETRYNQLTDQWQSKNKAYFFQFQLQGLLAIIIATPFLWMNQTIVTQPIAIIAMIILITGVIGESASDIQLQQFKKNNPKKVCNRGLWFFSRHPNYFFDWLTWFGFALLACAPSYAMAFVSPLCLGFIMVGITIPITEKQSIASRGQAYLDYMRKTPMFLPYKKNQ